MQKNGFLGIDVSKGYADFVLLDGNKALLAQGFKLYDTRKGHDELLKKLSRVKSDYDLEKLVCGVESTGGYENNWYRGLRGQKTDCDIEIYRLNPVGVKHQGQSEMTRTVTDPVSAETIARYLVDKYDKIRVKPQPDMDQAHARKFYHYVESLKKEKTRLNNQLEKLVYDAFPEVISYMKNGMPGWLLILLNKYPGSGWVDRAHVSSLLKIKGITAEKANTLKTKAKHSVGQKGDPLLSRAIQGMTSRILKLKDTIKREKVYLENHYTSKEVELLEQIKGVGSYSAIGAVMEIERVDKYKSASSMTAFFGMHPEFKQSGDGKFKTRMSKKGRAGFRNIMYMAARNVVNHNPYFKAHYAKFRAKGMNDAQAIGVIMNKLARVFYGVLKSGKAFDPKIDQANQQKTKNKEAIPKNQTPSPEEKKVLETELEMIKNAPCSRRTYRRKKMELMPQTSNKEVNTRSINST